MSDHLPETDIGTARIYEYTPFFGKHPTADCGTKTVYQLSGVHLTGDDGL